MATIRGTQGYEGGAEVVFVLEPLPRNSGGEPTLYRAAVSCNGSVLFERTWEVSGFSSHVGFLRLARVLEGSDALVDTTSLVRSWDSQDPRYDEGGEQSVNAFLAQFSLRWLPHQRKFRLDIGLFRPNADDETNAIVSEMTGTRVVASPRAIKAFGKNLRIDVEAAKKRDDKFWWDGLGQDGTQPPSPEVEA